MGRLLRRKAVAYLCGDKESIAAQEKTLTAYAKTQNLRVYRSFEDHHEFEKDRHEWMSDADTLSIGGLADLFDCVETLGFEFVLVTSKSFLSRQSRPGFCFVSVDATHELRHWDIKFLTPAEQAPAIPLPPPPTKEEKIKTSKASIAELGYHSAGPIPFGYISKKSKDHMHRLLVPHEKDARVVKSLFEDYLRIKSMQKLCDKLNKKGIRTCRGRPWVSGNLTWIFHNRVYIGKTVYAGREYKGQHEKIIHPITFNKVQKLLKKNQKRRTR